MQLAMAALNSRRMRISAEMKSFLAIGRFLSFLIVGQNYYTFQLAHLLYKQHIFVNKSFNLLFRISHFYLYKTDF